MLFVAILSFLLLQIIHVEAGSAQLDRIQARVKVESVMTSSTRIAGLYVNPPTELAEKYDPSVMRTNLYLFPDQTYLYAERNSFVPITIFDKGKWQVTGRLLQLESDPEITWNPDLERSFLILHRSSHPDEILLVGSRKATERFEAHTAGNPEVALLTIAKQRLKMISIEQQSKVRGDLIKNAWRPRRFAGHHPIVE